MRTAKLILILLFVACFSIAAYLQPLKSARDESAGSSTGVLAVLLGEGRKLFANALLAKADAYFHRGNYPSIFDQQNRREENHMAEEAQGEHEENHEAHGAEAKVAHDWIERFGQHFYPTDHVHLQAGDEREMLPWLRLSAEMDPHQGHMFALTGYWLRVRLNKISEAEQVLREGLSNNPDNPEILYELGRLYRSNRNDPNRAWNVLQAALRHWRAQEGNKKDPEESLLRNILDELIKIAVDQNRRTDEIELLQQLKAISPNPDDVQQLIDAARTRPAPAARP